MPVTRRVRVVVQARTSSTRLPGKVLMPMGGMPIAVLAARRASGLNFEVVLATSTDPSDDLLERVCISAGLAVVRGPLNNVLERYVQATADLSGGDLCVRLTADNVFPNYAFISEAINLSDRHGLCYARFGAGEGGLPYGLAAEVFTVSSLRTAATQARTPDEQEHVTTVIARRHPMPSSIVFPGGCDAYNDLRCTIDTPEDYQRAKLIYDAVDDPLTAPWQDLVGILAATAGDK